jgi:hypothetical protein
MESRQLSHFRAHLLAEGVVLGALLRTLQQLLQQLPCSIIHARWLGKALKEVRRGEAEARPKVRRLCLYRRIHGRVAEKCDSLRPNLLVRLVALRLWFHR